MAIDLDDEILQDFLIEAGEILDLLGEQLVQLEQTPRDPELLNAIFRGFHTVKGGAGFLAIDALVEICHNAEDVFNVLRQGERLVSSELMDVILRVLDCVNEMFFEIKRGNLPQSVDPQLMARLKSFACAASPTDEAPVAIQNTIEPATLDLGFDSMLDDRELASQTTTSKSDNDDITEQEFEELLDVLHGKASLPTSTQSSSPVANLKDDEISEEEFEKVLDGLHGKGKFSVQNVSIESKADSGDITETEFDELLDALHGKGKFNASNLETTSDIITSVDSTPIEHSELSIVTPAKPVLSEKPSESGPVSEKISATVIASEKMQSTDVITDKVGKSGAAQTAQADTTVRVDTQVLDDIMNMVGELVLVRNRFQTLKASTEASEQLSKAISNLDVVTADLQLAVMKTRMQPIKKVFGRFPRVVRDLARSLKKDIRLDLVGEETDLDKNLVEALADPLVHLVRNAVDHGIESPDEREAKGKPREGVVILKASQEGDHIQLSIKDDGKGMNPEALRAKVVEKGLMDEETAARLDDKECFNLIFLPGFSTKTEISDVSGRGVGMDVVKTRISQMNGVVEVDSVEGKGSTIIIKVPLTLAIMPTLMVKLCGQAFALPLASVLEILDLDLSKTNKVDGQLVAMVRNKALPLFYLSEWLVRNSYCESEKITEGHVVIVNAGGRQIGFVVDQLIGQEEVVIKPLGAKLQGLEGLSGATITGDGKIALILDVPGLIKRYAN
ncbi:chemotaxis protein CheA [Methylomonas sp. AM2-LC]|uniref:chemotaxis protein CheA n=1 Tax=Methylomonas sp. AM2-LC TaxID=3153301 RepID=UPI003262DFC5